MAKKITAEFRRAALRRGMIVTSTRSAVEDQIAYAGAIELANLGFVVDPQALKRVDEDTIVESIEQARIIVGADRNMKPIYPGFPAQVQALSTMTLLVEQILHYWTAGAFLPDHPDVVREGLPIQDMLRNAREVKVINVWDASNAIIADLVSNPVALSEDDKALLLGAVTTVAKMKRLEPMSLEDIAKPIQGARNGENIQSYVSALSKTGVFSAERIAEAIIPVIPNSDTLLRVVLALFTTEASKDTKHAGKYGLAVNTLSDRNARAVRMGRVPRGVRRLIVERLGRLADGYKADAVVGRQMLWRKVMTAVHPYDFTLTVEQKRVLDIIHSNVEYKTLNSLIEDALQRRDVSGAVELLSEYQPGNLLRRLVSLLRLVDSEKDAKLLAKAVKKVGANSALTTLVSAYNGVIAANDDSARVTRVAGLNNTMIDRGDVVKVDKEYVVLLCKALKKSMKTHLAKKTAPVGPVAVVSSKAVPLVRRDAATADRQMDRGQDFAVAGKGDTLRIFGHWNNNQNSSGYMDIGLVILDGDFKDLAVLTWNSWMNHRGLGTYSGDKLVYPGDSAAEYFDLELAKVKKKYPTAIYAAMTIQSYSGWPISKVDMIAGAMLRSKPDSGEVFDARSVSTAFKPTTDSTQSVPLAVDLRSGKLVWIDSSNGSTASGVSSTWDTTVGSIVYDELARPRLTLGELATLWAKAHGVETVDAPVDQDALMALL